MLNDHALVSIGINPDRCRAKAWLYKEMAKRARDRSQSSGVGPDLGDEPLTIRGQELSGSMREGQIGHLYQVSAECSLITEQKDGYEAGALAGEAYLEAGLPYGLVLSAIFNVHGAYHDEISVRHLFNFTRYRDGERPPIDGPSEGHSMRVQSMRRPEQMVWLFLAAANTGGGEIFLNEMYEPFKTDMDNHGHLPVGPLGIPISAHFPLFEAIRGEDKSSPALSEVFSIAMARRSEALSLAKRNSYLWSRVRSPVSLFDVHLFALANAAVRHGILNTNTYGDMLRSLDGDNPLLALISAPLKMALDQSIDPEPRLY